MTSTKPARYRITHQTSYNYGAVVNHSYHVLRLSPREVDNQTVVRHRLFTEPQSKIRADHTDFFGNPYSLLRIEADHRVLVVKSESEIEVRPPVAVDITATTAWHAVADDQIWQNRSAERISVLQFAATSRHGRAVAALADYARPSFPDGQPILLGARDLTRRIFEDFTFDPTATGCLDAGGNRP